MNQAALAQLAPGTVTDPPDVVGVVTGSSVLISEATWVTLATTVGTGN